MTGIPQPADVIRVREPTSRRPVRTCVGVVSIGEVERDGSRIADASFTGPEIARLAGRPLQTKAAFLAVKQALIALFAELFPSVPVSGTSFVLSHRDSGAPCLLTCPDAAGVSGAELLPRIHISLSHTRTWAYGLVAFEVPRHA